MHRGEVWWADLPAPVGRRPVVILTRSAAVAARNQLVVAQVTRTIHHLASEVPLGPEHGMPRPCVVNCDVLLTIPKSLLVRRITRLHETTMNDIAAALRFALELG